MVLLLLYSRTIIENRTILSNINKLKYLHLQAKIYLNDIEKYIVSHSSDDIEAFILNDDRYSLQIISKDDNNSIYEVIIYTKDETPIRVKSIIKK